MKDQEKQPQLSIEIDDATAQGNYCNLAFLTHSEQEFLMDFMFLSPHQPTKAKVKARIITSPKHAKRLLAALADNIKKYEARYGLIPQDPSSPGPADPGMMVN